MDAVVLSPSNLATRSTELCYKIVDLVTFMCSPLER